MFFKEQIKKRIKNEKGLTLVELLAVIVILGIIAAIAVPSIGNIINNSRDKAIMNEALNIIAGVKIAEMDKACDPAPATGNSDCTDTNTEMGKYVENAKGAYTVKKTTSDGNTVYSIQYASFANINKEYKLSKKVDSKEADVTILDTSSTAETEVSELDLKGILE